MSALAITPLMQSQAQEAQPLHHYASYEPVSAEVSNLRWSRVWFVASLTTLVGFIALSGYAIAYTSLYAAIHLPLVTVMVVAAGLPASFKVFKYFWDKSDRCQSDSIFAKEVRKKMDELDGKDIARELRSLGARPTGDPEKLKILLARHNTLVAMRDKYLEMSRDIYNPHGKQEPVDVIVNDSLLQLDPEQYRVSDISQEDAHSAARFHALNHRRLKSMTWLFEAASYNIRAAHHLKVAENPYADPEVPGVKLVTGIPPTQRLIAEASGDPTADTFLKKDERNYSIEKVATTSSSRLFYEIFSGRTWW